MSLHNEIEGLGKELSRISTLCESHQISKLSTEWVISKSDIEKYINVVGGCLATEWIYKENKKYYYLIFYPNGQDDMSKGFALIKIMLHEEIPENAVVKGKMSIAGRLLNISKEFNIKSFANQEVINFIETENLRIHNDLTIHCSIVHNIHYAECNFDDKAVNSKQIGTFDDIFICLSKLSDVTFCFSNNERSKAVKALLVKLPYFRTLFDYHDNRNLFPLNDVRKHIFDEFLKYLYTDSLPSLDFTLACDLFILAHKFEFCELKNICYTYLSASLTVKNVLVVLTIANNCNDISLKKDCFQFIKESDPDTLSREAIF